MGNDGRSWEDDQTSDPILHAMANRALENFKADGHDPPNQSLHTIAYVMALGELRAWRIADRLERIAQALEANLRGDTITTWQVLDIVHDWAREWERERLQISPSGPGGRGYIDVVDATYERETGRWTSALHSHTTKELFTLLFEIDEHVHLRILKIERLAE